MSTASPHRPWPEELQALAALVNQARPKDALAAASRLIAAPDLPDWMGGEVCNLAGAAAFALGQAAMAESLWREAIARGNPSGAPAFNLGVLLIARQRDDEAEAWLHRATAIEPQHAQAWLQLAPLLARRQRPAEADAAYRTARRLAPGNAAACNDHGVLLAGLQRWDDAEAAYHAALHLAPDDASTLANLGGLLTQRQQLDAAERCLRRAVALAPDNAAAQTNLGLVLEARGRLDEAEACHRTALAASPVSVEILGNLGNLLGTLSRDRPAAVVEAEDCHRRALAIEPLSAPAHVNLGVLLADQHRDAEAEALFARALELRPGYPLARLNLAFLLLAQGRWAEGWPLHEARHDPELPDNGIAHPDLPLPEWHGEPLAGRAVLVWPEQGLGDQIQFARYVPLLKAHGAGRVTLLCQAPLKALFETLPGTDAVLAAEVVDNRFAVRDADLSGHDAWVFPMSLPLHFPTTIDRLPAPSRCLRAAPDRIAAWSDRLAANDTPGRRIGLVWRGNPRHHNDAERSLPGLATLAPLWSVAGARFISLQAGSATVAALHGRSLEHLGADLRDFADSAAVLAQINLLICVDTSIAHLAGALGTPCWLLLPAYKTDWRWLRERDDTPWYPGTMRLFRQGRRGDWAEVIERVRGALVEHLATGRAIEVRP
jgi:Flp pilus assembly protein TadD